MRAGVALPGCIHLLHSSSTDGSNSNLNLVSLVRVCEEWHTVQTIYWLGLLQYVSKYIFRRSSTWDRIDCITSLRWWRMDMLMPEYTGLDSTVLSVLIHGSISGSYIISSLCCIVFYQWLPPPLIRLAGMKSSVAWAVLPVWLEETLLLYHHSRLVQSGHAHYANIALNVHRPTASLLSTENFNHPSLYFFIFPKKGR